MMKIVYEIKNNEKQISTNKPEIQKKLTKMKANNRKPIGHFLKYMSMRQLGGVGLMLFFFLFVCFYS